MGTPSTGKKFPPDMDCPDCGDILLEQEREEGRCKECQKMLAYDIAATSGQEHLIPKEDRHLMMGDYIDLQECIEDGTHLTDCDDDGFCNYCGHQELEEDCCRDCGGSGRKYETVEDDTPCPTCKGKCK